MVDFKEVVIDEYLRKHDIEPVDLYIEASDGLRESMEDVGHEVSLTCDECESDLLYSEDRGKLICPFCNNG